jgi:hypothetical protein
MLMWSWSPFSWDMANLTIVLLNEFELNKTWRGVKGTLLKTNSVAFSPQAKYIDWATANCWRNLVSTFVDRGVSRSQHGGSPTIVNLSFLDRSRYFYSKQLHIYPHKGWVDPVPDPLVLRKSGSAGNWSRHLWVISQELWPLNHRGGPGNIVVIIIIIITSRD